MKKKEFICIDDNIPELNKECIISIEFAVLMSLVKRGLLTNPQAEQCKKILVRKE